MKLLIMQFLKDVLILVLLELSLWEAGLDFSQYSRKEVLILVLLELSLWEVKKLRKSDTFPMS